MKEVGARKQAFDCIDDQVHLVELNAKRFEKVRRHAAGGAVKHGGKLDEGGGLAGKLASGPAAEDHVLDRVARYFRFSKGLKRDKFAERLFRFWRWGLSTPG